MRPVPVAALLAPPGFRRLVLEDRDAALAPAESPPRSSPMRIQASAPRWVIARESVCGRALPKQLADRPARFAPRPTPLADRIAPGRSRCAPREHRAGSLSRYGDALRLPVGHSAHSPG